MNNLVDIIIPSWNNHHYLSSCLASLAQNRATENLYHVYVVNNGHKDSCTFVHSPLFTVLDAGGNRGWEGGLKLGLEHSTAPFVCFFNDDAYIPPSSRHWLSHLLQYFRDDAVGAVGPSSNVVMGMQNIFATVPAQVFAARFLIGFCVVVRRSALDAVGGVDDTLPGGDDLDLSIRLRDKGYKLLVDRDVFVFHHGFKTGERIYGDSSKPNGWNSYEFSEKTDFALIQKHGFRKWYECRMGVYEFDGERTPVAAPAENTEAAVIRPFIQGDKVLDLGCGGNKTIPSAIGLDMVQKDDLIASLQGNQHSQADVVADVSEPLPFEENSVDTIIARHILEHLLDPLTALKQWRSVLKDGGRLILAVPDQQRHSTIPMNIEHVHAYTPSSLKTLCEASGLKVLEQKDGENMVSFITVCEKL